MRAQTVLKPIVYVLFMAAWLYQCGEMVVPYWREDTISVESSEDSFSFDRMFLCTDFDENQNLNRSEKAELKFIQSHAIPHRPKMIPMTERNKTVVFGHPLWNAPNEIHHERFQSFHNILYSWERTKAFFLPSLYSPEVICGFINGSKEGTEKQELLAGQKYAEKKIFHIFFSKPKLLSHRSVYISLHAIPEAPLLSQGDHFRFTISEKPQFGDRYRQRVMVTSKKYKNLNTKHNPCRERTGELYPKGFAVTACRIKCESFAFQQVFNCSHTVWRGSAVEPHQEWKACRSDQILDRMDEQEQTISKIREECEEKEKCLKARYCEEWQFDVTFEANEHNMGHFRNLNPNKVTSDGQYKGKVFKWSTQEHRLQLYHIRAGRSVQVSQEIPKVTFLMFFAASGGLLGFWLGFGLIDPIFYLFDYALKKMRRRLGQGEPHVEQKSPKNEIMTN